MLSHLDRYKEALASFEQALKIQPSSQDALLFQGIALHQLGNYKRAFASYKKVLGTEQQPIWQKLIQLLKGAPARRAS